MKKYVLFLFVLIMIIPFASIAQDDDVKRPKNIGVGDYDVFKNNSFDIKDESSSLYTSVSQLDKEIKNYSGIINTIGIEKLKTNLKALRESKDAVKVLTAKISDLDTQAKSLLEGAKKVKPVTKSPQATKNTNKSIKGLKLAKNDLSAVSNLLEEDIKLITDELKERGEPIE